MNFIRQYKEISVYRKKLDIITNYIHYPIATILCVIISSTSITPNMVTLIAVISELFAVWFIYLDLVEHRGLEGPYDAETTSYTSPQVVWRWGDSNIRPIPKQ